MTNCVIGQVLKVHNEIEKITCQIEVVICVDVDVVVVLQVLPRRVNI